MKNITKALVEFHKQLKPIKKDAQNPFYKSDYLTLSGILDAVRQPLASNNLVIIQSMKVQESNTVLITKLAHDSGEEIQSEMIMPILQDPQKQGSLITYYKRYQLQALLGISTAEEDDDGNSVIMPVQPGSNQKSSYNNQSRPIPWPASDAQKNALRKLKIAFDDNITKQRASELIAEANSKRG